LWADLLRATWKILNVLTLDSECKLNLIKNFVVCHEVNYVTELGRLAVNNERSLVAKL
jgi:hypothetical protein